MTTTAPGSSAIEQDYNNPGFVAARYAENIEARRFDAALKNAGQLVRHFCSQPTERDAWVEKFLKALVEAKGTVNADILITEFARFLKEPVFRAPESLIDSGRRLTKVINSIPAAARCYVGQFLLQGLSEVQARGVPTGRTAEAKLHLQALHRYGVKIVPQLMDLITPFTEQEILVKVEQNTPPRCIRLITQEDRPQPFVILEQNGKCLTSNVIHQIFTTHWPRDLRIRKESLKEVIVLTLGFDIADSPTEVSLLMNPMQPNGHIVPSTMEYMREISGYSVPDWSRVADEFVRNGGVNLKSDL